MRVSAPALNDGKPSYVIGSESCINGAYIRHRTGPRDTSAFASPSSSPENLTYAVARKGIIACLLHAPAVHWTE